MSIHVQWRARIFPVIIAAMMIWPFNRKAPIEQKSLGNPSEEEIAVLTGAAGSSSTISVATALSVPAVSAAVRLVSEAPAALGCKVVKIEGGKEVDVPDHPVAVLLRDQVNDYTCAYDFIRDMVASALCYDKGGLAFVNRIGGEVREIVRYEPAHFTVDYSADGRQEPSYRINNVPMPAENIIHLRGSFARCAISLAADAITACKNMELHASSLFKNAARPAGVIEIAGKLGDEGLKKMKSAWQSAHEGPANTGKTAVLWDGAKFNPITMNSTDSQFLENRKHQLDEIARAFRVPPSMIYELDRATWSNSEQMGLEFLNYSLEPWLKALEGALRRGLFLPEERKNHRIVFDRDDLTKADLGARATAISSLISVKVINPNEGREWLDLAPYKGGDEFSNPHINTDAPSVPAKDPANGPQ